jgi:hypothetical protein
MPLASIKEDQVKGTHFGTGMVYPGVKSAVKFWQDLWPVYII